MRRGIPAAALALVLASPLPAAAQVGAGLGGPGTILLPSALETQIVGSVEQEVAGSTGEGARDAAIASEAQRALGLRPGDRLSAALLEAGLARVRRLDGVADAAVRLASAEAEGVRTRVVLVLVLGPEIADDRRPTGMLAGEGAAGFPILWRSDTSLLRFIVNGGMGAFSDGNPWFGRPEVFTRGNPLVEDPGVGADTGRRASWIESWVELGLGGVTQVGDANLAVYGAATWIAPASIGQDIFRDDTRATFDVEKLYAGVLAGSDDRRRSLNVSLGRQNFTLNDGFLISQYGSQWNAGPRPGVYLAPRTTHDFAALGTLKLDRWTATAFYLDPNEYEPIESDTVLAGFNLRHDFTDRFHVDASVIHAIGSDTRYAAPTGPVGTREGLWTYAAHLRWADPAVAPGLWLEGELAHQRHSDFDMSAWAGYGTVGFLARDLPWTPSLSYRFSGFSGDDPETGTYERFDALYNGGLGEWLQGISISKLVRPENRLTHRLRLNVAPDPRLNLTLDWFLHRADQLNNLGANPAIARLGSRDLGQELQLAGRWAISDRLYFLGVAGAAFPGRAIEDAAGGDAEPWTTLQAQLFWNF
jgi:hypothetical protein